MIAVSGLDMAAWDALAKATNLPLCVLLGGTVGPVRAYNSNGLWLKEPNAVAAEAVELRDEGGFTGLKLRLGRERVRDDVAAIEAVPDMALMVDFNQGFHLGEALQRCHMIDDLALAWIEEPIVYDNIQGFAQLTAELRTPIQIGENFYGTRDLQVALQQRACDFVILTSCASVGSPDGFEQPQSPERREYPCPLYPEVAAHVMRVTETAHWLEWQDWADPVLQKPYEIRDKPLQSVREVHSVSKETLPAHRHVAMISRAAARARKVPVSPWLS